MTGNFLDFAQALCYNEIMKTVMIKEDIISRNNERAKEVRALTKEKNIFYINVMSSPGGGSDTYLLTGDQVIIKDIAAVFGGEDDTQPQEKSRP